MKALTTEEKELLLKLLIEDKPFSLIKKELGVNKNYNLKSLCEYLGKKYLRAYELHINNITKSTEIALVNDENLTKADFLKGMDLILSKIQNPEKDKILIENTVAEKSNTNGNTFNEDIYEIIQLPKILPVRLQGENYVVKQTSVKVVDNVWQEFQQFVKANKTYSSIEYLSLAILEFLEKYRLH